MMLVPTSRQLSIRDELALNLLIVAPAGCGKTEALALRVQGLLRRNTVALPQKILVITFSNRARDNVRDRLRLYLSYAEIRDRITVTNFHGLSARIFRAHSNVIGLEGSMTMPESDWVGDECRRRGLDFPTIRQVQKELREAKQDPRDDTAVEDLLHGTALSIERKRKLEKRLTYDDLPRLAELILQRQAVSRLYRAHFGAIVVDEYQDLTLQQLRIVRAIGETRTTYAGDLAQGIYNFAGAQPLVVDDAIRKECPKVVQLNESHRSSPAVLEAVNSLLSLTGGLQLKAADPGSWPSGGLAGHVTHADVEVEAKYLLKIAENILRSDSNQRIGVISRSASRRRFADDAFASSSIQSHRWDDGVLDPEVAKTIRAMLLTFDKREFMAAADKLEFLRNAASFDTVVDPTLRESLAGALGWCCDLLVGGKTLEDIEARIKVGDSSTLVTVPGVHLLTGHVGKGQQFDWVFVLGMEDGVIPNFNAVTADEIAEEARVLAVMISRARHGVILSNATATPTLAGKIRPQLPSRFFSQLSATELIGEAEIDDWFAKVDWTSVANR